MTLKPDYWQAYFNRADALRRLGRKYDAIADFKLIAPKATDTTLKSAAEAELKDGFGIAIETPKSGPTTVLVQYVDPADARMVALVADELRSKGYDLRGPELVTRHSVGTVAYFRSEDADRAAELCDLIQRFLEAQQVKIQLKGLLLQAASSQAELEVWLPPLSKGGRSFSAVP